MERLSLKPGNMLYPLPVVLVSCGTFKADCNIITIAWAGTINTNPPMLSISLRPERFSYELIKCTCEFVVNLPTKEMAAAVDLCGVKSGRQIDKFKTCGFQPIPSLHVGTPSIAECPVSIECKVTQIIPLGSHSMFLAEVIGVTAWAQLLNKKTNAIELHQAGLLAYAHGGYYGLSEKIGHFGFSVKKRKSK